MARYIRKVGAEEAVQIVAVAKNGAGEPDHSCFSEYPMWLKEAIDQCDVQYEEGPPRIMASAGEGLAARFCAGDFLLLKDGIEVVGVRQGEFFRLYEACA